MNLSQRRILRRPGSIRLTEAQYDEMEQLGLDNESAYIKYKMNAANQHMKLIKNTETMTAEDPKSKENRMQSPSNSTNQRITKDVNDIQRLEMENWRLQEKMEQLHQVKDQALNGVHQQVGNLLKEELQRRDFDQLKKDHETKITELDKLETQLKKAEGNVEEKEEEIKSLLKKLSLIELGKVLLPGAISGLAKRFPSQMQGLASTLGAIGGDTEGTLPQGMSEQQQNLLQIAEYFRELFPEEQFEQLVQLVMQMGETIKTEPELFHKIRYYLKKLKPTPET